jgi:hypothetical protein
VAIATIHTAKVRLADADVERRAERPRQVGLGDTQLDHRELRGGEREEDAEREEARERCDVVGEE